MEDMAPAINANELPQPDAEVPSADLSPDLNQETIEAPSRMQRLVATTKRIGHMATRGSQTAMVLLQLSPANEIARFSAFGAAEAMSHSPVTSALVFGVSTLGIEAAGAVAGAPLLDTGPSQRVTNFLHKRLSKTHADEPGQTKYSRLTKISTAYIGGTVPAMALEKLEDPSRTAEHTRRFGLWTSAWLAGACAVQGAAMSEGIDVAANNTKLAGIVGGTAAVAAGGRWLKRRLDRNRDKNSVENRVKAHNTEAAPRHDLTEQEYDLLQEDCVKSVEAKTEEPNIYGLWLPSDHRYANLVRTQEAKIFPEIPEIMKPFENNSVFLTLVDTRPETRRIVHAFRLSWPEFNHPSDKANTGDPTNIALLKDIVSSNQGLTTDGIRDYYRNRGIDLARCLSVETNFRIGSRVESEAGIPVSELGYIALFSGANQLGDVAGKAAIFAHLNKPAIKSLGVVGIEYEPIAGRPGLKTPTVGDKKFDDEYEPVCIPASAKNMTIFKNLMPLAPAIVEV